MKRPTYLEAGQRKRFGKTVKRPIGQVEPAPDPAGVPDFDLGTWRVRPSLSRMTRADRIVALDGPTLRCLLVLHEAPPEGVSRAMLAARVFDPGAPEEKLRRCLSLLRRVFGEDGSVRIENAPGDHYCLWTGPPVPGRARRGANGTSLTEPITAISAWTGRRQPWLLGVAAAAVIVVIFAGGLVFLLGGLGHSLRHEITALKAFAAEPGIKTSPSFAPDGRQVVYSWAAPGEAAAHLYVRASTGGAPHGLTSGPGDDRYPVWSPGGGLIAFVRLTEDRCELWTVLPDGTNARRVGDCATDVIGPLAFSRDGRALTFPNRTSPLLPSQLVSLNLNTGALTGVSNPTSGMPGDSLPALAANARRLVFLRTRSPGVADISMIETTAGGVARVTHDLAPVSGILWEPDSRTLMFASSRGGPSDLWTMPADGGVPRFLLGGDGDISSPALSADGHRLIFERAHRTTRLMSVALYPGARVAPATPLFDPVATDRDPSVSPDRRHVAFVSNRTGKAELWVADVDGHPAHQLTHERAQWLATPRWSADGTTLVVTVGTRGESDLYAVDAASGAWRRLTRDSTVAHPSFSRDGRQLYYSRLVHNLRQIWRCNWPSMDGAVQLTTDGGTSAIESTDRKRLYFVRPDRTGLWSRDLAPGGDELLVTADLTAADADNWFVSGNGVYFVTRRNNGAPGLAHYGEDTEAVMRLRDLPHLLANSGLSIGVDDETLLYAEETNVAIDLEVADIR